MKPEQPHDQLQMFIATIEQMEENGIHRELIEHYVSQKADGVRTLLMFPAPFDVDIVDIMSRTSAFLAKYTVQ